MTKWPITLGILTLVLASGGRAATPCTPSSVGLPCTTGVFVYDGAGNICSIGNDTFSYDAFGRLVNATLPSAGGVGQTYSYDAAGNLKLITYTQGGVTASGIPAVDNDTWGSSNHLKSATYDDAGDVTSVSGMTFTYDASGMATSVSTASGHNLEIYTADDERIGTLAVAAPVPNTKINLKPYVATWRVRGVTPQVLRELTENAPTTGAATWTWTRDYVYRDSMLLAESLPLGASGQTWRQYHLDHLGTPRLITDAGGAKISVHHYYPFGEEITSIVGQTEVAKFTGHERDFLGGTLTENKQYIDYMHARSSGSVIGRFLSVDPIPGNPLVPRSWNRYSYVMNNPIGSADPTGMYSTNCTANDQQCLNEAARFEKTRLENLERSGDLHDGAEAYGAPTDVNGVIVNFVKQVVDPETNKVLDANGGTTAELVTGESVTGKYSVQIKYGLSGTDFGNAVVHEGTHVSDAKTFVGKLQQGVVENSSTVYQTEMNAYMATAHYANAVNQRINYNGLTIAPKTPDAQLRKQIDTFLKSQGKGPDVKKCQFPAFCQ